MHLSAILPVWKTEAGMKHPLCFYSILSETPCKSTCKAVGCSSRAPSIPNGLRGPFLLFILTINEVRVPFRAVAEGPKGYTW